MSDCPNDRLEQQELADRRGTDDGSLTSGFTIVPPRGQLARALPPENFTYRGGPLLKQVEVTTIFWGTSWIQANARFIDGLNSIFDTIFSVSFLPNDAQECAYLAPLRQYSAPNYPITGFGSRVGSVLRVGDPMAYSSNGHAIGSWDVEKALSDWVASPGTGVPQPNANTLYFVIVEGGKPLSVRAGNTIMTGCSEFLGYHAWSYKLRAPFAVVPFYCTVNVAPPTNNWPGGADDEISISISHELVEAITNPMAFQGAEGWVGPYPGGGLGEIADSCGYSPPYGYLFNNAIYLAPYWANNVSACVMPQPRKRKPKSVAYET